MTTATDTITAQVIVATFDDFHPVFRVRQAGPIKDFPTIGPDHYSPRGNTPLRDATMKMIQHLEALQSPDTVQIGLLLDESYSMIGNRQSVIDGVNEFVNGLRDEPVREGGRVLCVIFTDGLENASHEITAHALTGKVRALESMGWTFIYMGANQDAWAEGSAHTGISGGVTGQSVNFTSTPAGTSAAFRHTTRRGASYLAGQEQYNVMASAMGNNSVVDEDDENAEGSWTHPHMTVDEALKKARGEDGN
jgi:hypothetical protein